MVKSGLVDDPRVSPVRLAAHLGPGIPIYLALMLVDALGLLSGTARAADAPGSARATAVAALCSSWCCRARSCAAIRAGFAYNTCPLMNGAWFPPEILVIEPWWNNFVHNMATVQFDHRLHRDVRGGPLGGHVALRCRGRDARAGAGRAVARVVLARCRSASPRCSASAAAARRTAPVGAVIVFTCAIGLRHALRATRLHT
jgi:cytochrome c oxidase assembly protein subunit 15